ncbi:MAG: DUF2155 domain-containing protein [Rickettsiaceae bacterium]|jgi:hypothetical protein|nr:DUF2155 domain-containing protein [Rickettsiaceae bacterium]MCP5377495.1 DUF2155 domain-containing protein [Rickettsiaceae bacterium]
MEIVRKPKFKLSKYWIWYLTIGILFVYSNNLRVCKAEDEEGTISILDEIEQGLINQSSDSVPQKIERKDLIKLEEKKKESISSEITLPQESNSFSYKKKANIIVLNKITAKSELVKFELNKIESFGNLSVEVHKCAKNNNPLRPANLILITVFDNKPDGNKSLVFDGWMDSSNLAISTLEHPVYEIMPRNCVD